MSGGNDFTSGQIIHGKNSTRGLLHPSVGCWVHTGGQRSISLCIASVVDRIRGCIVVVLQLLVVEGAFVMGRQGRRWRGEVKGEGR